MKINAQLIANLICFCSLIFGMGSNAFAQNTQTNIQYLSGTDNENTIAWDFYCTNGRKSGEWTTIEVPSCWEQQGFGNYDYGRDYRTFGKQFKFSDEQGIYRYEFEVEQKWKESQINLVFEGVMTDAEVKINGVSAGAIHQGAFYRFKYNITEFLHFKKNNKLEVTVSKMSANKSVNRAERYADYWIFGGIFRPVYLEILPKQHIEQATIAANAKGRFESDVFIKNINKNCELELNIFDSQNNIVATQTKAIKKEEEQSSLSVQVKKPLLWTSETPNLYRAEFLLKNKKKVIHKTTQAFGFRSIEIRKGDGVYINGQKIKFKGINRHVFHPETGRTINRNIDRLDIELMKHMNMNAVRCAHYPPDKSFLELCDSMGLYVLNELAGWQNAYDTEVGEKLVREMVLRDVNHPSVVFWSNGNEGGTNKELDDDFHKYDLSARPVIHAHHKPGNEHNGIDPNHYEKYYSAKSILEDSLIYMPTEFLHAQDDGGAAAGLDDFWEMFWNAPRSAGGFLWALLDEGVVRTDLNGYIDVNRVNAPDGVLGPHREKEGSVDALREIFSPIVFPDEKLPQNFSGKLEIENRYHFVNLKDCKFKIQLLNFEAPNQRRKGHIIEWENLDSGPNVPPLQKGKLNLNLPANWQNYDALYLHAFSPNGEKVITRSWAIRPAHHWVEILQNNTNSKDLSPVQAEETDTTVIFSSKNITAIFERKSGKLLQVKNARGLNPLFGNGPVLVSGTTAPTEHRWYEEGTSKVFEIKYNGDLKYIKWTMYPTGLLQLDYEYFVEEEVPFAGVSFDCPESHIMSVEWLGNGPYRVWKNRMKGGNLDIYKAMYNNTHTGSAPWQYPEFKGYFSDVSWMLFNTVQGRFLVGTDEEMFVRLFDFHALSAPIPHPKLPIGDVSFLDCIPPIGTKLATGIDVKPGELGPQSEWTKMDTPQRKTLYFLFENLNHHFKK